MVNKAVRTALERLWKDRCSIFIREEVTDPVTHLTDSEEKPLLQDQPCKLSFETLTSTNGDEVATAQQVVKLFLSPDVKVPAGCKIIVTRPNDVERTFTSGGRNGGATCWAGCTSSAVGERKRGG